MAAFGGKADVAIRGLAVDLGPIDDPSSKTFSNAGKKAIIDFVEKDKGRKLTAQEINLSLDQRAMGEL